MKTIQYLEQIRRIDIVSRNKLADLNKNIERVKMSVGISGVSYDKERVQTSNVSDPTSKPAILLASMEQETNLAVNRMLELRRRIVSQIESIENLDYYDILFRRFVMNESFNQISNAWKYSWGQTKQIYNDALNEFERLYGDEYLDLELEFW
jgi:hypothetical protein